MFRTILILFRVLGLFIKAGFQLLRARKIPKDIPSVERDRQIFQAPAALGKKILDVTGSTVTVEGLENIPKDGAVLFVGNHQSILDIPLLLGYLEKPHGYVAKVELAKVPIVAGWLTEIRGVFMNRSDRRQSLKAIKAGIETLKLGHSLVIFPEGTRSQDGTLLEFKPGSLTLATKSGVPIVPITLNNTHHVLESNRYRIKPATITLKIAEPIFMEDIGELNSQQLTKKVQDIVANNLKG